MPPLTVSFPGGGIPDAAAIHAARKKREAAREARERGGGADFIPVSRGGERGRAGPRLVREEDQEEELDEGRLSFTVKQGKREDEYHRRVGRGGAEHSDSDPEWEMQQINKAITRDQVVAASHDAVVAGELGMPRAPLPPSLSPEPGRARQQAELARPAQYDLPGIRERMAARLQGMREQHKRHQLDEDRAVDDLVESQREVERLGGDIPRLAEKHKFYQELRGYMTDLTECYDEKMVVVQYLEGRVSKLQAEWAGKLRERRRQDVKDQAEQLASLTAANAAVGLDLVGDAVRDYRAAEREGRRTRRRQAREGAVRTELHQDGMSSDEEMPSGDTAALGGARREVEQQAGTALEDVVEEFSLLESVAARLAGWRQQDMDSYQSAYVSLCLPKVFSPLVSAIKSAHFTLDMTLWCFRSGCSFCSGRPSRPTRRCTAWTGTTHSPPTMSA